MAVLQYPSGKKPLSPESFAGAQAPTPPVRVSFQTARRQPSAAGGPATAPLLHHGHQPPQPSQQWRPKSRPRCRLALSRPPSKVSVFLPWCLHPPWTVGHLLQEKPAGVEYIENEVAAAMHGFLLPQARKIEEDVQVRDSWCTLTSLIRKWHGDTRSAFLYTSGPADRVAKRCQENSRGFGGSRSRVDEGRIID